MNKKQLGLQNASLFAKLERKAKEIEILNIRLEEAENQTKILNNDIYSLQEKLDIAQFTANSLKEENEQLTAEITRLEVQIKELKTFSVNDIKCQPPLEDLSDYASPKFSETDNVEEEKNLTAHDGDSNDDSDICTDSDDNIDSTVSCDEVTITETLTPPSTEEEELLKDDQTQKKSPINDIIRDYGATVIGRVTRVTAETLSKIGAIGEDAAESLKTLALGKNESLKFQIMELAAKGGNPEEIKNKMDLLAEEAIVYLKSI